MSTSFTPAKAAMTKEEIAGDVSNLFDGDDGYEPISADEILDSEAQAFVDRNHAWLQEAIYMCEDDALNAESEWMREWLDGVRSRMLANSLGLGNAT